MPSTPPIPTCVSNLYNLTTVLQMCRGNNEKVLKLVNTFITTTTAAVAELQQASQLGDTTSIQRIAHRIKPTLSIYGIHQLEQEINLLMNIEKEVAPQDNLQVRIEKVSDHLTEVIKTMRAELPII